ncbi:DUF4198 domain-containing protein [Thermosulfuriphilus ammonigenes]|uniref:DUF4198 domain-containing protein n=1 Tax=Thermosulfuriphilus ammonigenes TaxID=1936021 RepID=A0A6G7PUL4_9BACT|nr:DUF4198 domain-containing protein [Thermosulfuriphilus ammonigenes]MBA2848651.1 nickel transport protein [Thermosulfuriphilus ammonigenes]QIJ71211.1 DUF4198 domain-containing protein [Thermosulfuriphilus ammonigenes]
MKRGIGLLVGLFFLLGAIQAEAHRINVFAYQEGDEVSVEVYFNDGSPAKGCLIEVYPPGSQNPLITGHTDSQGRFRFALPPEKELKIVAVAELGHRAEFRLTLGHHRRETHPEPKDLRTIFTPPPGAPTALSEEKIRQILDQELDRRLTPLYESIRELAQAQRRPSPSEIIGGLGYIAGLFGLLAYIYSRKNRP